MTFKYMNVINSRQINEQHNRMLENIQKTVDSVNTMKSIVDQQTYINGIDRRCIEMAINDMYSTLDSYNDFTTIRPKDTSNVSGSIVNKEKNYISKEYVKSTSKLYLDKEYLPGDLILEALADADYPSIIDTDISTCVGKSNVPWVREITANNTIDSVYTTLFVYIPYSITTNDFVNEISFDTFPFNTSTVESIQYSSNYDTKYMNTIDEIKHNKGCIVNQYSLPYSTNKNHIHLNIDTVQAKVIAITLKQEHYIQEGNNRKFFLGLKNLNIAYNIYSTESMQFEFAYTPKSSDGDYISKIEVIYNNEDEYAPIIKVYQDGQVLMNNFAPFTTSDKPITFRIIYTSDDTPNINRINVYN